MTLLRRTTLLTAAALLIGLLGLAGPASAHVEATGTVAGEVTTVRLNVEHGCGTLDLTGLRVQMPAGATRIAAQNPEGWTSAVSAEEIAWTGGPQPATEELAFTFSLVLAQPVGSTVRFPTIELCPGGEEAWIESTPEGGPEPEHPAPQLVVEATAAPTTSTAPSSTTSSAAGGPTVTMAPKQTPITEEGSATHNSGLVVLLVVMVIIIGGAVALFLRNRRPRPPA